jgi:hypothetical protein
MTMQRQTNTAMSGKHDYSRESALDWIAPRWRADLAQMTPARRAETIALARQRAAERPGSYLAQHLRLLYGES